MGRTVKAMTERVKVTAGSEVDVVIRMEFGPWGYHATPWGHYVNEGIPEFPPSPYRLMRALVDVWKRGRPDWPEERVIPILSVLSSELPVFSVPPYSMHSVPIYQDTNSGNPLDGALVYDSFVMMNRGDAVFVKWECVSLSRSQLSDLAELLSMIDYLGRTESWVDMTLADDSPDLEWNCVPAVFGTGNSMVAVPAPMHSDSGKWFDALAQTTAQTFRTGTPRGMSMVSYSISSSPSPRHAASAHRGTGISAVLYSLRSADPPAITETLAISGRIHVKLMGIYSRLFGPEIPPQLSGRNADGTVRIGPGPVSIWPYDSNGDGKLDAVLVFSDTDFSPEILRAITSLTQIWQTENTDAYLTVINKGSFNDMLPAFVSTTFTSETPFIPKMHYHKKNGTVERWVQEEVSKECRKHGLPVPSSVSLTPSIVRGGRTYRWDQYVRNRKGGSPMPAFLLQLTFGSPVRSGMFALGYDSHFGSGLFAKA